MKTGAQLSASRLSSPCVPVKLNFMMLVNNSQHPMKDSRFGGFDTVCEF